MSVDINYVAIIVAAIVNMIVGYVWYGPAFGKTWLRLAGVDNVKMNQEKGKGMGKSLGLGFLGALLMSSVLFYVISYKSEFDQTGGMEVGLSVGFWLWLGIVAPVTAGKQLWEGKSWTLWVLESGYYLFVLLVNGAILAGWM